MKYKNRFEMRNIIVMSRNNHRYASRENYDSALQRILPATVPWFTSNRFARKSNYPRGEHAEKPRIKKHWDLRKISTRYKSRPPRNLLFLVPIPHSLSAAMIDNRRGLSLVKRTNASANLSTKFLISRAIERTTLMFVAGDFAIAKRITDRERRAR